MIVGTKKTLTRGAFGREGFAKVIEITNELHATKGWRTVQTRHGRTKVRSLRIVTEAWYPTRPPRQPRPLREVPEKAKLRHKWYRRQKEREARLAATEAYNEAAQ